MSVRANGSPRRAPWSRCSERGLRPRNPYWGEVRKGGEAPLRGITRIEEMLAALGR